MKKSRILLIMIALVLVFVMAPITVNAASTPKLSMTKVTLPQNGKNGNGHLYLWVTGTTKTAKWSTSNKKIVSIEKLGTKNCIEIMALKKGKATITAKVGKKTLKCKVTVTKPMSGKALSKFVKIDTSTIEKQYFTIKNTSKQYYLGIHTKLRLYNDQGEQADWNTPHAYLAPNRSVKIWIDNPHKYKKATVDIENTWIDYEYHPISYKTEQKPVTEDNELPIVVTNTSKYKEALYYVTVFFKKDGKIVWTLQTDTDKAAPGKGINPGVSRTVKFWLNNVLEEYDSITIQVNRSSGY